jgi:hypothetical protein
MEPIDSRPFEMPSSPDELLAAAVRRDVEGRLEAAMQDDAVIAEFLSTRDATVIIDVVVDRSMEPGGMPYLAERPDDAPFSPAIGQPAVLAMVTMLGERIIQGPSAGAPYGDQPVIFEIAVRPEWGDSLSA